MHAMLKKKIMQRKTKAKRIRKYVWFESKKCMPLRA